MSLSMPELHRAPGADLRAQLEDIPKSYHLLSNGIRLCPNSLEVVYICVCVCVYIFIRSLKYHVQYVFAYCPAMAG